MLLIRVFAWCTSFRVVCVIIIILGNNNNINNNERYVRVFAWWPSSNKNPRSACFFPAPKHSPVSLSRLSWSAAISVRTLYNTHWSHRGGRCCVTHDCTQYYYYSNCTAVAACYVGFRLPLCTYHIVRVACMYTRAVTIIIIGFGGVSGENVKYDDGDDDKPPPRMTAH